MAVADTTTTTTAVSAPFSVPSVAAPAAQAAQAAAAATAQGESARTIFVASLSMRTTPVGLARALAICGTVCRVYMPGDEVNPAARTR